MSKLKTYESFFHKIQMYHMMGNVDKVHEALSIINSWSYAHRQGNGSLSDRQVKENVKQHVKRMENF